MAGQTRERLIEAATMLFLARGYSAVGTREICDRAEVNKGTFYHFFPSKAELAVAVVETYGGVLEESFRAIADCPIPAADRLARLFQEPLKINDRCKRDSGSVQGCLAGNMIVELGAVDDRVRQGLVGVLGRWEQAVAPIISDLVKDGTIPPVPAADGARALIAFLQGLVLLAKAENDPQVIARFAPGALGMLQSLGERTTRH